MVAEAEQSPGGIEKFYNCEEIQDKVPSSSYKNVLVTSSRSASYIGNLNNVLVFVILCTGFVEVKTISCVRNYPYSGEKEYKGTYQ